MSWRALCSMGRPRGRSKTIRMRISETMSDQVQLACRSDAAVLITGPTGAGKTRLAREIHERSSRAGKPFIEVNLASLHEGTFESELFGHERGAFTGADQRRTGRLEAAQGGTVFLDEIGELPLRLQSRLLEFLQTRCVSPVGRNRSIRLNVRVIAATNKDLRQLVAEKRFREDLLHRLRIICLELQPIRERPDEFDELVHGCLSEVSRVHGRSVLRISDEVAKNLESYDWPGNIRELRNVLEYAVIATEGSEISARHLPPWFYENLKAGQSPDSSPKLSALLGHFEMPLSFDYHGVMAAFEKEFLSRALFRTRGRINHTARKLGMSKATLIRRMRAYGLYSSHSSSQEPSSEGPKDQVSWSEACFHPADHLAGGELFSSGV